MATRKNVNSHIQVKEINNKRWICQRVIMTETTKVADYDFLDNADGKLWKKIRPLKKHEYKNPDLSGITQYYDDKIADSTNSYVSDDYWEGDYAE